MLNLKVFGEEASDETVTLRLKKDGDDVILTAVDENGCKVTRGNLLRITASGIIYRLGDVPKGIGFQLNESCRIVILDHYQKHGNWFHW